jgi:hypothetical protein
MIRRAANFDQLEMDKLWVLLIGIVQDLISELADGCLE